MMPSRKVSITLVPKRSTAIAESHAADRTQEGDTAPPVQDEFAMFNSDGVGRTTRLPLGSSRTRDPTLDVSGVLYTER